MHNLVPSIDSLDSLFFSHNADDLLNANFTSATSVKATQTPIEDIISAMAHLPPPYTGPHGWRIHPDTLAAVARELGAYKFSSHEERTSTLLGLRFIKDYSIPLGFARPFDGKGNDMQPDLDLRTKAMSTP